MQNKSFIFTTLIFLLTILAVTAIASRKTPVVVQTNLENIPMQIGIYTAKNDVFPQTVYDELNADKHVYRHYQAPDGQVVDLYIGYYGTAKGGRTGHNPYACLPGAGWGIVEDKEIEIFSEYKGKPENINLTVTRKEEEYNVMLHWYQSAGTQVLESGIEQNIYRFVNRILKNKNDGAFIQVSARTRKSRVVEVRATIKKFAEKLLVMLPEYWPEEKEL